MIKKLKLFILVSLLMLTATACSSDNEAAGTFEGENVRTVIGSSSTTGDSYLVADGTMRELEKVLNANIKVDAVGAGPAFEVLHNAEPDGTTMLMFHDMTYLGISFGAFDERYALENMEVGPMMVSNPGSCFAATASAPYNDMVEMADYLRDNPEETVRINIEAGGVSHIGFIAYYEWLVDNYGQEVADRIRVIIGGSTAEKSQMMWDGNTDVIFADYTSLLQYTEEGVDEQLKMKYVGLLDNIEGVDAPSFADLGITVDGEPFRFAKDFAIYLPSGTSDELMQQLEEACKEVSENPEFIEYMNSMHYKVNFMPIEESREYLIDKRDSLDELIQRSPSLDDLT